MSFIDAHREDLGIEPSGTRIAAYWGKEPEEGMWLAYLSCLVYGLRNIGLALMVAQP